MKKRKTLHIVTIKELDKVQNRRDRFWFIGGLLITLIAGILLAIYAEYVIYAYLTIVAYIVYVMIMTGILERFGKIEKIRKQLGLRNIQNQNRKRAMMEKNKKTKPKKTSKKEEPVYLKHDYPPVKNPDMYDIDMDDYEYFRDLDLDDEEYLDIDLDDYYEYLDNRDKKTYEPRYKPSVTEWLGGYLIASKAFDKLFKSNNKNKEY